MNLSIICATYNTSTESVKPAASRVYVRTWWATVTAFDALMGLCKARAKRVSKASSHASSAKVTFVPNRFADQDEGVQAACDAVGVVAFRIVSLPPPSRRVAVSRGLLLLNASLYRQRGVAQLQAILMRGDACERPGPPAVGQTRRDDQEAEVVAPHLMQLQLT